MPGLASQFSDPSMVSAKEKKNTLNNIDECIRSIRKVCVFYHDPDATDSSSDDEDTIGNRKNRLEGKKQVIGEILVQAVPCESAKVSSKYKINGGKGSTSLIEKQSTRRASSTYKVVRRRKGGKYETEVRDPIKGVRTSSAFQKKKLEFDTMMLPEKTKYSNVWTLALPATASHTDVSENTNGSFAHPSPSSVLDISTSSRLDNGTGNCIKEEITRGDLYEEQPISSFFEEPLFTPTLNEALNLDFEQPSFAASTSEALYMGANNSEFFGIDLDQFYDGLHTDDLPMCDIENDVKNDLHYLESDMGKDELAWIDETLNVGGNP